MKKYLFILIIVSVFIPLFASAGNLSGPLVPCGREGQKDCTLCDIFVMLQTIIDFITVGIFIFAPIFIAAGGIVMLTSAGAPDKLGLGKNMIKNAIIGIVIALLAWTAINMIFNKLVSQEEEKFPWPWNKIKCEGGGVGGGEEQQEGEYCACEVPVYDLDPNQYPNNAGVIGTNIKVTKLASKDECIKKCVLANSNNYCPSTLKQDKSNLYCSDEAGVKNKRTCSVKIDRDPQCQISGGKCWSDPLECAATVTPGTSQFNSAYVKRCFINGQDLCGYSSWVAGARTYCPEKVPPCTSDKPYTLYRFAQEKSYGEMDALRCSTYSSGDYSCRLNCEYNQCAQTPSDVCNRLNPPLNQKAACSWDSYWTCQQGVSNQWNDACTELRSFINCMKTKGLPSGAREISSISDNSPETSGNLPGCFKAWTSQCSGSTDSCTGTCCGHSRCSLHYGGKARSDFGPSSCGTGTVDCRKCSWAVDFANESYLSQIKTAAENCAKELWDGSLENVRAIKEENHVHVELNGIAEYHRCK